MSQKLKEKHCGRGRANAVREDVEKLELYGNELEFILNIEKVLFCGNLVD